MMALRGAPPKEGELAAIDLQLLTVDEAAQIAGCHRQTITRAADAGRLPEVRTSGHLRYRLYFMHDITRWAKERESEAQRVTEPNNHAITRVIYGAAARAARNSQQS
jgi:excisionase family DNA binding protein